MKKRMKQKILIGSIFVALLLLLSTPFVSTLQAQSVSLDESKEATGSSITIFTYWIVGRNQFFLGGVTLVLMNDGVVVRVGRTNILGEEAFYGLPMSGSYTVTASARNYKTKTVDVDFGYNWIEIEKGEGFTRR